MIRSYNLDAAGKSSMTTRTEVAEIWKNNDYMNEASSENTRQPTRSNLDIGVWRDMFLWGNMGKSFLHVGETGPVRSGGFHVGQQQARREVHARCLLCRQVSGNLFVLRRRPQNSGISLVSHLGQTHWDAECSSCKASSEKAPKVPTVIAPDSGKRCA